MSRIYFVNLPKYEADTIPLAIAILQGVANKCGYDARFTDFNLELDLLLPEQETIPRDNGVNNNK